MKKQKYLYITFFVTSEAIATEQAFKENEIEGKLVPVPRVLSTGCGIAWRGIPEERQKIETVLSNNGIEWDKIEEL